MGSKAVSQAPFRADKWSGVMKQERVARVRPERVADPQAHEEMVVEDPDADLLTDIDELLDEIDAVLEDQSMLVEFRQRSGQ
jgi:Pup-like protein